MRTSEFEYCKSAITKYFYNDYKWKYNDYDGGFIYYKNPKKCLKELRFIIDVIFQDNFSIIGTKEIKNYENKIVGYSVIGEVDVIGDFNGVYQGEGGGTVFIRFSLCTTGFYYNQSSKYESLVG